MEILLQKGLPHQDRARDAVVEVFDAAGAFLPPGESAPTENVRLANLWHLTDQIKAVQHKFLGQTVVPTPKVEGPCLGIDVKMETGTGKTYVYTETMFALHQRYGVNKFIIVVPSLPIKEGAKAFLGDPYVMKHFRDACGYGATIDLQVVDPIKKKKGKRYFPSAVRAFVEGTQQMTDRIYVLLLNMQLLTNAKVLTDEYDQELGGGIFRPVDALKAVRPFVIIDEPHRFAKGQQAFKAIMDLLAPQCLIRYGATFPLVPLGIGRKAPLVPDYTNLVMDLDACEAFNSHLIKGIVKEHLPSPGGADAKVKVTGIDAKEAVHLQLTRAAADGQLQKQAFTLAVGDSLGQIDFALQSLTVTGIARNYFELSNGETKDKGAEFAVDLFSSSYQERMLDLALERHFETELENFKRPARIKTLALFFIDDVESYRANNGRRPFLRIAFEKLLRVRLQTALAAARAGGLTDYADFLQASLDDIPACHGGYFAKDNSDADEAVQAEIDLILRGKKELVAFKNAQGKWNTMRFLFSKWTLKEGWDNPNVFTIAKLRTSGSEISKLQEVGRGLRLPVDESGARVSDEGLMLNYIVDFTEADFATRLVAEINAQRGDGAPGWLTKRQIDALALLLGMTSEELGIDLLKKHYIKMADEYGHHPIVAENRDKFLAEYPQFMAGLQSGRVKDRNQTSDRKIKIRPARYDELKDLWEKLNRRYLVCYDPVGADEMVKIFLEIFNAKEPFRSRTVSTEKVALAVHEGMAVTKLAGASETIELAAIPYGEFLLALNRQTSVPVRTLHQAIGEYLRRHGIPLVERRNFNSMALDEICQAFEEWKVRSLQKRLHYEKIEVGARDTGLTDAKGHVYESIAQERIGAMIDESKPVPATYLYDTLAFDSPLEKDDIVSPAQQVESVAVFGKIPKRSIRIPVADGGTYSPDFMYVVKHKDGHQSLNVVIETKDEEEKDIRPEETMKMACARIFFGQLKNDGIDVVFRAQFKRDALVQLFKDLS